MLGVCRFDPSTCRVVHHYAPIPRDLCFLWPPQETGNELLHLYTRKQSTHKHKKKEVNLRIYFNLNTPKTYLNCIV